MSTYIHYRAAALHIITTAIISLLFYCGAVLADNQAPSEKEQQLRETITGLTVEGLSLSLTPAQAHKHLTSNGYQIHKGSEAGHGIYWKNESKTVTKRIRLKSSEDRIYQIQFSFAEKKGIQTWQCLLNHIKEGLGRSTQLCKKATEQELNCMLISESPTQLSAEITTSQSDKANRIKVRLDQRTAKISLKSKMSFGSPQKP